MSERWGPCRTCRGIGEIKVRERDGATNEIHELKQECGSCGGTGHSGDAADYLRLEAEKEQQR